MANRPVPEIEISERLVRSLLREQAPALADESLTMLGRGWDNTNWRLGDDHIARLPHRAMAAPLIAYEQRWLPHLAPRLDVAIPAPVFAGSPSADQAYPWKWSVVPWAEGVEAARAELSDPARTAVRLGQFFAALHTDAPADAPTNEFRGGSVQSRAPHFEQRCAALIGQIDTAAAERCFADAMAAPATDERVWLHGDLHTRNMVVDDGDLSSVIDWGDICSGDRSTDLAGAFMLVPDHIDTVAAHAGADDDAWRRARGWALHFGAIYLVNADDDPVMSAIGERLLRALGIEVDR